MTYVDIINKCRQHKSLEDVSERDILETITILHILTDPKVTDSAVDTETGVSKIETQGEHDSLRPNVNIVTGWLRKQ